MADPRAPRRAVILRASNLRSMPYEWTASWHYQPQGRTAIP
jgi:hypothetical protein